MKQTKRRFGDRKDGVLLRNLDGMHFIVPLLYPNRCDNEAFISERIDLAAADEYLRKRNAENPDFPFTLFHLVVAALIKTVTLRPKMNRFIANKNMYQRNEVSASFVVKKQFVDEAHEGLAFVHAKPDSTLDSIHEDLRRQILDCRSGKGDASSDSMEMFNRMPRFLSKFLVWIITKLDKHGWVPQSLIDTDPYYSSVVLTNLGSIGLKCGYHHLTNWGTSRRTGKTGKRNAGYVKKGAAHTSRSFALFFVIPQPEEKICEPMRTERSTWLHSRQKKPWPSDRRSYRSVRMC